LPLKRRIAAWIGVDRNPLRRPIDRFECAVRLILILIFLVGAPLVAPAVSHVTWASGSHQVRRETSWSKVPAVLLRSAPGHFYGYGSVATFWVPGRWIAPSGAPRTGLVPARAGNPAGSRLSVWVDRAGKVMGRSPLTMGSVRTRTVMFAIGSVFGLAATLLLLGGMTRLLLNRRRMITWGLEWACFGPRWTTRRWPRS